MGRAYRELISPHGTLDGMPVAQRNAAMGTFINISHGPNNWVLSIRAAPRTAIEALLTDGCDTATPEAIWSEAVGPVAAWTLVLMQRDGWDWHTSADAFFKAWEPETYLDEAVGYLIAGT